MGIVKNVVAGAAGAEMLLLLKGAIEKQGGVKGIVQKFEQSGLGKEAQSWVGMGPNKPVTPDQVHAALGPDTVQQLATKAGMPVKDMLAQIAQHLPGVIDKLTPNGTAA
ncbi:MAG: YidB family protein [Hyphomonas sp.]|nr:DUF937 domain-containing protein [Hyphomonas sp.]MCB9961160.1 DUF937 domain-containing protein [Hyphomonas sp.]MCB9970451.1 DUF937 domain-containing protein [Hyphomonas sp.]